jgi:GDP-L-fucose synthase
VVWQVADGITAASRVYVAGHGGLVGSSLLRRLKQEGFERIITRPRSELDLTDAARVDAFFSECQPEYVFLAAAKVGGILANATYPADFLRENLRIALNVLDAAHRFGVKKLLYLGSSCIYPSRAPQPLKEEYLLTGELEPTNEAYAVAKIAGLKMCQAFNRQYGTNFITVMPSNLYGPDDNFDPDTSHVLPALLRKMHVGKVEGAASVTVWGSGTPRREFLHADDLADACLFLMRNYHESSPINVGTGEDVTVQELAELVRNVVGYPGDLVNDRSKPDGTSRKVLDVSKLRSLGWRHRIELEDGIKRVYRHVDKSRWAENPRGR